MIVLDLDQNLLVHIKPYMLADIINDKKVFN